MEPVDPDLPPPKLPAWYEEVRRIVKPYGGFEIELPPRDSVREPPAFD